MSTDLDTDWILYSFNPPLVLKDKERMLKAQKKKPVTHCAKCQRYIGRGIYLHQRFCKG